MFHCWFLDLSAAFDTIDTIDHSIFLNHLKYNVGVNGTALSWFASYLTNIKQRIHLNCSISEEFVLKYGVPQGSCRGPLLFIIYASAMSCIIETHLTDSHGYADDTQLYCTWPSKKWKIVFRTYVGQIEVNENE